MCHKRLVWRNYGRPEARGAWEVEHSRPRAWGGSDRLNNLYPACVRCNREKGSRRTNREMRARHGKRRAPLSREKRVWARLESAVVGGLLGMVAGSFLSWDGAKVFGLAGALLGFLANPDR